MKNFRDLHVWHKAYRFTLDAYAATGNFPKQEIYGLSSQIRRCAVSIPRTSLKVVGNEEAPSFSASRGSLQDRRVNWSITSCTPTTCTFSPREDYRKLTSAVTEVKRMLRSLIHQVESER
jgi:four helix bundle protein